MSTCIRFGDLFRGKSLVVPGAVLRANVGKPTAVVGVNGAGKTTLLMALAGVLQPGAAFVNEQPTNQQRVAFVPQDYALLPALRTDEHCRLYGIEFDWLESAYPDLYLTEVRGKRISKLSPGQRQTVSIAIALGLESDFMLFDEPFSALDIRRRAGLREYLRIKARQKPVLLSSQVGADLTALCDHFILLRGGRIVFDGDLIELVGPAAAAAVPELFEREVVRRIT